MANKEYKLGSIGPFPYDDAVFPAALDTDGTIRAAATPVAGADVVRLDDVGGGGAVAPSDAEYVVVSLDSDLSAERVLAVDATNLSLVDGGANGNITLDTIQNIDITATPQFAGMTLSAIPAGVDNSVLVSVAGVLSTDEIDSRVWGSSLVNYIGTPANNQIATFVDVNTIQAEANLTFDGSKLSVTGSIFISDDYLLSDGSYVGILTAERLEFYTAGYAAFMGCNIGIETAVIPHGGVGYAKFAIEGANASAAGPHVQFTTATNDYPLLQIFPWAHDDISLNFDCYYEGGAAYKSSDAGSSFTVSKIADTFRIRYDVATPGAAITWNEGIILTNAGYVGINDASPSYPIDVGGDARIQGKLLYNPSTELTISSGVITVTQNYHEVDTEGDAASDDLDTISGGVEGMVLVLRTVVNTRDVVLKNAADNIFLQGAADFTLSHTLDTITLIYNGLLWVEVSRSSNV